MVMEEVVVSEVCGGRFILNLASVEGLEKCMAGLVLNIRIEAMFQAQLLWSRLLSSLQIEL